MRLGSKRGKLRHTQQKEPCSSAVPLDGDEEGKGEINGDANKEKGADVARAFLRRGWKKRRAATVPTTQGSADVEGNHDQPLHAGYPRQRHREAGNEEKAGDKGERPITRKCPWNERGKGLSG